MKSKIQEYITLRKNLVSKLMIRNTALLLLTAITSLGRAQTLNICAGNNTVITAINGLNLSNPSYSLNPGGITSTNASFTVTPTITTTYTLYVTGTNSNSAVITTSNIATVNIGASAPVFSLTSPNAYTIGCASKSVCVVNIVNANTVPPGGSVTYTFIAPGSTGVLPSGSLSPISTATLNVPGIWTVAIRDFVNFCTSWGTFSISTNTTMPAIGTTSVSQNPLTCNTPSASVQTTPNSALSYNWLPSGVSGHSISVAINSNPTQSLLTTLTLVATDNDNLCQSNTVIPVYQNIFPPNAAIYSPTLSGCQSSIVLTNVSTTGIPNGLFPNSAPVVGFLWEGPSPQTTLALSSTYLAYTTGMYTLTAMDMNNGCTKSTTSIFSAGLSAAFTHTITGGQAVFQNPSNVTSTTTTFYWDFGDGNTSTLQNPTHNYLNGGAYLVKHKITDNTLSCSDSLIQSVTISGIPCVANSIFSMVPTATAQVWNIVPSYPWNVTAALWNWGDGSASNSLYTSHQYSAAGLYTICLSVTVSCGFTSTTCTTYSVYRGSEQASILLVNVVAPELISGLSPVGDEESTTWSIVPNPNGGEFKLNLINTGSEWTRVVIRDISGRIVHDQSIGSHSGSALIYTPDLLSGLYLVTLETDKLKTTKRMVVYH